MYYLKFTIKDYTTQEIKEKISNLYEDIGTPMGIMERYVLKQNNYIDIRRLENHKILVIKNGGEILIEILKKENKKNEKNNF